MPAFASLLTVLFLLVTTGGCTAHGDPSLVVRPSAAPTPDRLTCPSGRIVSTDGGLLEADAVLDGTGTPGEAVEAWMATQGGADYVLTADPGGAWVLRADGTARARVTLMRSDGWLVHGYEACTR